MPKSNNLVNSMTGFGAALGEGHGHSWTVEARSVNARGLDIRTRLPDGVEGLERAVRAEITTSLTRGSVNVGLRLTRLDEAARLSVDPAKVDAALAAVSAIEVVAARSGRELAPTSAADILSIRGVLDTSASEAPDEALLPALVASVAEAVKTLKDMRAEEGAAIAAVLRGQIDTVATLTEDAATAAGDRAARMRAALETALAQILESTDKVDAGRVEGELALIAVKADVTEELDRLRSHVDAARKLLDQGGPIGRKLDFLSQEFNREANTLCSKAGSADLTRIGLDLKAVIDQMREQVQNVE